MTGAGWTPKDGILLEACVASVRSAVAARDGGADRIELCASPDAGGLTPEASLVEEVLGAVDIPVHAMVRPRAGDFLFTESEFALMKETVTAFRRLGCAGIVTGILTSDRIPDTGRTGELVRLAGGMDVTFHRAIDDTVDIPAAAALVAKSGARRILTSGGAADAPAGAPVIAGLVAWLAAGQTVLSVIAGGGVTTGNAAALAGSTGVREVHSRRGVAGPDGEVDARLVRAMKRALGGNPE